MQHLHHAQTTDAERQELQQEFQMLAQHHRELRKHFEAVTQRWQEIQSTQQALQEIAREKKGSILYTPIAQGIFIKANLEENSGVLVNVGSDVVVEKSFADAQQLIHNQLS